MTAASKSRNFWLIDTDLPEESPKGLVKVKKAPGKDIPIVIDFGSFQCRAGYGNEDMPALVFDQMVHRVADKDGQVSFAFGRTAPPGTSKTSSRSPFDSGLVVHFTSVERTLDHIFETLKVTGSAVDHPIILSEPFANPEYIRQELLEMLFEGYGVPRVAFTNDILPSLRQHGIDTSLVLSFGNYFTTASIVQNGQIEKLKRIDFGGSQAAELLLKMVQCKYPTFPVKMSIQQAQCAMFKACLVADDYLSVLSELETLEGIQKHDFTIQFPYPQVDKALEKERALQTEALQIKRREMAERLRERAQAKRVEKLKNKEDRLSALQELLNKLKTVKKGRRNSLQLEDDEDDLMESDDGLDDEHFEELRLHGFEALSELEDAILEAEKDLRLYKNKLEGIVEEKEQPVFDLVDIPDNQLTEEQIKEKRKQRLLKASADAREKMRLEKEAQSRIDEEKARQDEEWRLRDFESWKTHYYQERQKLSNRIKSRQKQREALADRRSLASSSRLRNVMSLVDDEESGADQPAPSKKKKTAQKRDKRASKEQTNELDQPIQEIDADDNFGDNDSDWQIYRQIRRDELSDEEEDEQDQESLTAIEAKLEAHDTNFYDILAEELSLKATIIDLLRTGGLSTIPEGQADAVAYQIHMNVERYRVPEVLFQPSIAGIDQAGIVEIIEDMLSSVDSDLKQKLVKNVFMIGGMSVMPGLCERLTSELSKILPVGTPIKISTQKSPLDAWKGITKGTDSLGWIDKKQISKKNK